MSTSPSVGVIIITHCAKHHLAKCLKPIFLCSLKPKVLVVNSSSNDGTAELAKELGAEVLLIPRSSFNHGATREYARQKLDVDIVVMITPDAYLESSESLTELVRPILEKKASVAYARQIPHKGSDFFESFPREFNYPRESHIRSLIDIPTYGVYSFFCSNSCAAYLNNALDEIGGFPHVLLGEDTVVVAKLLKKGHKIAYVAEALVRHSHRYTLKEEFKRSFDTGLARKGYQDLIVCEGTDAKRGMGYSKEMFKRLFKENPFRIPYAFTHLFFKWLGYQIGRQSTRAPLWWKRRLSSQDFYWINNEPLA